MKYIIMLMTKYVNYITYVNLKTVPLFFQKINFQVDVKLSNVAWSWDRITWGCNNKPDFSQG